jgi:uncharacterized protein (TIGR03083 family)
MSTTIPRTPTQDSPRRPALDRPTAMTLAETAYQRFLVQLRDLSDDDWSRPTDCPDWDVRAMASHVLAQAEMAASVREGVRAARAARRRGGVLIDALTALQVAEHSGLSPAEVVERFAATAPKAARARRRTPWFLRRLTMPGKQIVNGHAEVWSFGYAVDVMLTRDTWMHGIDISRATGRAARLTPEHDGVLVADVVAEWAERHAQPCRLHLTGPAGGAWAFGSGGQMLELDAVQFCRILSGRGRGTGLLTTEVPF